MVSDSAGDRGDSLCPGARVPRLALDELTNRESDQSVPLPSIQLLTLRLISSRISLVLSSFSSSVPPSDEGSVKLQCRRLVAPGKIGHFSALVSSHTVTTKL